MRLRFVLGEALVGLKRNFAMVVSVVLVTFVSLTFVGGAALLQLQIQKMKGYWFDQVQISIYLCGKDSGSANCSAGAVTDQQRTDIEHLLGSAELKPYVARVFHESQQEAYQHFKDQFASSSIVGSVTPDQMPESFRVRLVDPHQYQVITQTFSAVPGVDQVSDQRALLEPLFRVLNVSTAIALGIAGLMLLCAVLLVATTIRLSAYSRRRETGIMRLVGASNIVIETPFVLEGAVAAFLGAALAAGSLWALVRYGVEGWMAVHYSSTAFIGTDVMLWLGPGLVLFGVLMAALCSAVTLRRYLKV